MAHTVLRPSHPNKPSTQGACVGDAVNSKVGSGVGLNVGEEVGDLEGISVGLLEGSAVGLLVAWQVVVEDMC